jgi:transposase
MARAYSHDLRSRVLDAVATGASRRQAAARYRVGIATVVRWAARAALTGQTRAGRQGRPRGSKLDAHEGFLLALIDEADDITLAEMQARLRVERRVSAGLGTLWRFFARRAVTWKKRRRTRPSRTAPTWRPRAKRGSRASPSSIPPA